MQPQITGLAGDLRWLDGVVEPELWAITQDDDGEHSRLCTIEDLARLGVTRDQADPSLVVFLESPHFQRRIRSCTGCYLDLGDASVGLEDSDDVFIHFLSDQQWVKHWLVCCGDGQHRGTVVATDRPYGFADSGWGGESDDEFVDLVAHVSCTLVADSFEEFLQRLWIENEIYFAGLDGAPEREHALVRHYRNELSNS